MKVTHSSGTLEKTAFPSIYKFSNSCPGEAIIFIVSEADTIHAEKFRFNQGEATAANPRISLSGIYCMQATKEQILARPMLEIDPPTCTIQSFEMWIAPKRGDYIGPLNANGPKLTDEHKTWIKKCGKGDRIFLENIKIRCRGTDSVFVAPANHYYFLQ